MRSTLELADRLASKSTSDPILEEILIAHPDPFDAYRLESEEERDVFTVLPLLGNAMNFGRKTIVQPQDWQSKKADVIPAVAPISNGVSITPLSVSDVLGFNQPGNNGGVDGKLKGSMSPPTNSVPIPPVSPLPSHPPLKDLSSIAAVETTSTTSSPASSSDMPPSPINYVTRPVTPPSSLPLHTADDPSPTFSEQSSSPPASLAYQRQHHHSHYSIPIHSETEPDPDPMRGDWGELASRAGDYGQLVDEDD